MVPPVRHDTASEIVQKGSFYDSSVNLPVARSPQLQELPGPVNSIESCCLVSADRRSLRLRNS